MYDIAEHIADMRRTKARYYREGRQWDKRAVSWEKTEANARTMANYCRACGEEAEATSWAEQAGTWRELAANAKQWAEESRERGRRYSAMIAEAQSR